MTCTDTTETRIVVEGRDADEVSVEQHGSRLEVIAPRHRGGFFGDSELHVTAVVPTESNVAAKTGSADVTIDDDAGATAVKSGSGEVQIATSRGPSLVEAGYGDVRGSCTPGPSCAPRSSPGTSSSPRSDQRSARHRDSDAPVAHECHLPPVEPEVLDQHPTQPGDDLGLPGDPHVQVVAMGLLIDGLAR